MLFKNQREINQYIDQLNDGAEFPDDLIEVMSQDDLITLTMDSFTFYGHRALNIKTKTKGLLPFSFNRAQWYLTAIAERQKEKTGKVRVIIVKGRQQGISTWVEGRGYWYVSHRMGADVVILTHETAASRNLFTMAKRYHEHCPAPIRPVLGADNNREMTFPELDSSYKVATAGSKGTGRSQTARFFHGSEVAFWPNAEEHSSGIMQAISEEDDTEVYLESTAFGNTGFFAEQWEKASYPTEEENPFGNGYIRVFIPWFWEPSYRIRTSEKFELTAEEVEYKDLHGLDDEQMQWRRKKIAEVNGDVNRFCRDYPATPEEAFNSSLDNQLVDAMHVIRARNNWKLNLYAPVGPVVLGVDVAREGNDATCIVVRCGRVILHMERMWKAESNQVAKKVYDLADKYEARRTFIDNTGGFGGGVLDFLRNVFGYDDAIGVHFSESAHDSDQFKNIRSEMWWKLKLWLEDGAQIPDSAEMQKDFCAPTYRFMGDKMLLESKDDMKKRGIKSPDIGDATALTFAHPVNETTISRFYDPDEY